MSSVESVVAVNYDPTSDEASSIVDIITGHDEAVVEIEDNGSSNFARIDPDSHRYTAVPFQSPVTWSRTNPKLSLTADPPAMAVVITMYNEESDELQVTLKSLARCLKYMCRKLGQEEFWKRIVVVIVSDGREKVAPSTLAFLERLDLARPASMAQRNDSVLHVFESCPAFCDDSGSDPFPNMQLIVAIKEKNAGKINSHWWFFEGFCQILQPKYCVLIDVGTKPRSSSLYAFWKHFEASPSVAGVCGQITTRDCGLALCIPVIGSQHFEYKIASVLDKSFESTLGYMAVLPGAFSAYRFSAIRGDPLTAYFSQLFVKDADLNPLVANMMLAEDRVLCFQLIAKEGCDHILRYLNSAVAETDVPHDLARLLKQRRRWLNGSFFALLYALSEYGTFYSQTTHSSFRKVAITFEFLYFFVSLLTQWFALGLFPLINIFVLRALKFGDATIIAFVATYCFFVVVQFLLASKNDPVRFASWYNLSAAFIGLLFMFLNGTVLVISMRLIESGDPLILITIFLSFGAYILSAFLHGELVTLATSSLTYLFMMPTFLIILPIFAFCNVHDVSWGTKDIDQAAFGDANASERIKRRVQRRFQFFRARLLFMWIVSNVGIAVVSIYFNTGKVFLLAVLGILVFLNGSRFAGSVLYLSSADSNSAWLVKVLIAPIRLKTYCSLIKLPLSALLAIMGLALGLVSYCTGGLFLPLLKVLARLDLYFTHWGTSNATYRLSKRHSDIQIRRYFMRFRIVAATIAVVGVSLLTLLMVKIGTGQLCSAATVVVEYCHQSSWLRWLTMGVVGLLLLNVSYSHDHLTRRVAQKWLA